MLTASWFWAFLVFRALWPGAPVMRGEGSGELPPFGQDTVLVWKSENQGESREFVVRLATFLPDRYFEWEDSTTQGTVFLPSKALSLARAFVDTRLFEAGADTRGKDATTLWLSERLFGELKAQGKVKASIDSIDSRMTLLGPGWMSLQVNRSPRDIAVLRVADDRGSERWILDDARNPLIVKHLFRSFSMTLVSATTDRPNTLRWIKGRKLVHPPGSD
jgi:hypothetical protein